MKLPVASESRLEILLDYLMLPIMYILQWNFFETPQRTHFWNNTKLAILGTHALDSTSMISVPGDSTATQRWLGYVPIFHMPIFGGWKEYVVIAPHVDQDVWFVGWLVGDTAGISRVTLRSPVRLLLGSSPAHFFGLNEHGEQIVIREIGRGTIGKRGQFSKYPLL